MCYQRSDFPAPIPLKDKVEIVKQVKKMGMKPKPEISMMYGAGAGTHIAGYQTKLKILEDLLYEIDLHQAAGAESMMLESEGITEHLPAEEWKTEKENRNRNSTKGIIMVKLIEIQKIG